MILSCQDISISFAGDPVLRNVSFHLEQHDRAALIGVNGAGKSTLLKIITGELTPDSGSVTISRDTSLGYLAQYQEVDGDITIYDEVKKSKQDVLDMEVRLRQIESEMKNAEGESLSALMNSYTKLQHEYELENGYAAQSEISGVLKGLGFSEEEFGRKLMSLSGGQKTRVVLGKLLLEKPDILLLDEPTNHLDIGSIEWLESYLMNYPGTVLIVSHDRYFLNRIVNRVIEIENGSSMTFSGNYDEYSQKKSIVRKSIYNTWMKQQNEIRHQQDVIAKLRQFNREKSIRRAESREKMLDKMDLVEKPQEVQADMHLELHPRIESGHDVLTVRGISKSFSRQELFRDQDIEIKKGERVAVIGDNGTGKSTLLKMITGLIRPDAGEISFGSHVHVGYYDQEQQLLDDSKTIFEQISDDFPTLTQTEIRNVLAAFLFTGDDVFKRISSLSGGERGRVSLARLMLSEANFLILDEPTNHLDIVSKEILEDALNDYSGTVLFVSHDRWFINRVATRILDLTNHTFVNYIGNYDYYLEKRGEMTAVYASGDLLSSGKNPADSSENTVGSGGGAQKGISSEKLDWQAQKEQQAAVRKKTNQIKKLEEKIAELENRNSEIDQEFMKPEVATDVAKCQELSGEQSALKEQLDELYEKWEELSAE